MLDWTENANIVLTALKKIAAILFLAIAFFNLYGYQIVISYLQSTQESNLESRLDNNNYKDAELITIKLPVNLPYYTNSENYERVNGSVELNGIEYKYVKRRVYNDTIELACIPNYSKKEFQSAKYDFVKLGSENQNTHQDRKTTSIKIASFDYCDKLISFSLPVMEQSKPVSHTGSFHLSATFKSVQEQPPDNSLV